MIWLSWLAIFSRTVVAPGADSWCSSDSDSGLSDLHHLADKISFYKRTVAQYERYDAAVCASKWQGSGKVPGGDHEYIDVVNCINAGSSERVIIDVDFRSHFEIARAVDSYDRILKSLPVIYVGSLTRLKQYLQDMAEAARSSLKQNSMPLPPWRSLAYLQAKWYSPYQRQFGPDYQNFSSVDSSDHKQCGGHLRRLQSSLRFETEGERLMKPINSDNNWRAKFERRKHSLFRAL
ncbi:hypothetical protein OIU77_012581 [Salix suchowensis]|uniref:Uncharacterized protein n=1 Tax=Salix suchowensis TaxID=1278906 RepID=A0ABQ9A5F2_9ROSI|nr:hypothetical protein OIU77_012581 [Salix suchowensis]